MLGQRALLCVTGLNTSLALRTAASGVLAGAFFCGYELEVVWMLEASIVL